MPTFTVTPITGSNPPVSQVLLQLDTADMSNVDRAYIYRVNETTGDKALVRPGELDMTAGPVVVYDTEFPLDTPIHYIAYPGEDLSADSDAVGIGGVLTTTTRPAFDDDFNRVVAAGGWGTASGGVVWSVLGGATASQFSVNGTQAVAGITVVGGASQNIGNTADLLYKNSFGQFVMTIPPLATGASYSNAITLRRIDGNNHLRFSISMGTDGLIDLVVAAVVGGTTFTLNTVNNVVAYTGGEQVNVKWIVVDKQIYFKIWIGGAEPATWNSVTSNSTGLTLTGGVGHRYAIGAGNTNTTPITWFTDNQTVTFLDTYNTITMPSALDGLPGGWIRDPLRPCNDVRISLCQNGECPDPNGIVAITQDTETYVADTARFWVQGRRRPVVVADVRKDATGRFVFATVSFADRDALLNLLEPDDVLFFQFPPEFGIPDRYYDIGDVQVSHIVSDLRVQWRLFDLPYVVVDAPVGPAQGVCGTRWMDLCVPDTAWSTWDDADASGLTIEDVLAGQAAL